MKTRFEVLWFHKGKGGPEDPPFVNQSIPQLIYVLNVNIFLRNKHKLNF